VGRCRHVGRRCQGGLGGRGEAGWQALHLRPRARAREPHGGGGGGGGDRALGGRCGSDDSSGGGSGVRRHNRRLKQRCEMHNFDVLHARFHCVFQTQNT